MSWRITWAVIRKELLHIFRDGQTWLLVIFAPAVLLIMFAYLFSLDVDHFTVVLLDEDNTRTSRAYWRALTVDGVVEIDRALTLRAEVEDVMVRSAADAAIILAPGFERDLLAGSRTEVQVVVDGADPNTAGRALGEISSRSAAFSRILQLRAMPIGRASSSLGVRDNVWYNPTVKSLISMVPGLLAVVLIMPAFSAAQALAKEKEMGTAESLLATPIRRAEVVLGKGLPYLVTGMLGILLTAAVAVLWFRVPFRGSFWLLMLLGMDFLFASNFMALMIANFVDSQQAAMIIMFILFFLPSFFLSGLIHPPESAALGAQIESALLPASYFVTITRGLFLKGVGMTYLWRPALSLFGIGAGALILAVLTFRNRLA